MIQGRRAVQASLRALWVGVVPAVLAGLVLWFLVPPRPLRPSLESGLRGAIGTVGHLLPVPFAVALFFMFSLMARYWRVRRLDTMGDDAPELDGLVAPPAAGRRRQETAVTAIAVALAAATALLVRARVVDSYQVISGSMVPTFEPGDRVVGRRTTFTSPSALPRRGDVVIFRTDAIPAAAGSGPRPDVLVKRVIGLPGDTISMDGEVPIINGWPVPRCTAGAYLYVSPDGDGTMIHGSVEVEFLDDHAYLTILSAPTPPFDGTFTVPAGQMFVLGDSRGNSVDSRAYGGEGRGGGVPLAAVEARADWFLLGTHRTGEVDFSRFFQPIARVEHRLHLEGMSPGALANGISKCLASRPAVTRPPPAAVSAVASSTSR